MTQNINKRFFSFEGIDFSGKSTQIRMLHDYLKNHKYEVYVLREPGGTVISEKIRSLLLDKSHQQMSDFCEIFLYSAARTQLVTEKIIPLLQKGYFVIADRYVDSTTVYQGYGRGINAQIVDTINQAAIKGLMPSLTFYLEITPQDSYLRRSNSSRETDRLEESGAGFFNRVYQGYQKIAAANAQRYKRIDGKLSIEEIHQQIIKWIPFGENI